MNEDNLEPQSDVGESTEEPTSEQTDTSDSQDAEQSAEEKELYELPDGSKVPMEEALKKFKSDFWPEFTRRSQKLRELEQRDREMTEREEAERLQREALDKVEVPPEVKEAVLAIVRPEVENTIRTYSQQEQNKAAWDESFDKLGEKWDGTGGKPKYNDIADRERVFDYIEQSGYKISDPMTAWEKMHEEEIKDYWVKDALRKQKGRPLTEQTGTRPRTEPKSKPASTWQEARKRARARVQGGGDTWE